MWARQAGWPCGMARRLVRAVRAGPLAQVARQVRRPRGTAGGTAHAARQAGRPACPCTGPPPKPLPSSTLTRQPPCKGRLPFGEAWARGKQGSDEPSARRPERPPARRQRQEGSMEHEDSVGNGGSVEDQRPVEHDDAPRAAGAPLIDTSKAHSARVYNYILGGKDNYPVDVAAAEALLEAWPKLATSMRINRDTMQRMARWLAAEAGIRQFLDIGTGLPTEPNLHEVVQEVAPESRVVYVDNDPIVLAHARALLTSSPEGRTAYIDADMRSPWQVLEAPELRETLDLGRPIGVTVIAMLQFVEDAGNLVRQLTAALPKGSYLALTTATADITRDEVTAMAEEYTRRDVPMYLRTRSEVEGLFSGMEMVDPGVVPMNRWKPEPGVEIRDEDVNMYAGVGRVL
ncbi:hypothetical protein Sm713_58240 [Streptomyces sp. TS71-3]|nr:hypothetical protein Sm713_58240 [Streptomyces sp. TS71-3]